MDSEPDPYARACPACSAALDAVGMCKRLKSEALVHEWTEKDVPVIAKGGRVARRDIEKIIGELGEIRRMLADPPTGITALQQVQESRHSKVLEHVTYSTTGVREENRELRRRQERMLSDLGQVRTAVDDLRREIAQAWAHTLGLPHIPSTTGPAEEVLRLRQTPAALEAGDSLDDERKDDLPVPDEHTPDAADTPPTDTDERIFRDPPEPAAPARRVDGHTAQRAPSSLDGMSSAPAAPAAPAEVASEAEDLAFAPAAQEGESEPAVRGPDPAAVSPSAVAGPAGTPSSGTPGDGEQQAEYRRGLLAAAAVSSARLICHKDTWAFLVEKSLTHAHFRLPDRIGDTDDGQIDTHLSGRSLLAVLVTTQHILDQPPDNDLAAWALAHAIHTRTHQAVTATTNTEHSPNGDVTTIVLDDRPPATG
ncbi:hypothetical protein ACIRJO_41135 [Streptomyces sp. NPDC102394]|uniref:hypothetical protein n=1 Tax=Streptomyces sp. NPDC102394 TaxID=3366167 RepID=UPI00382782A9